MDPALLKPLLPALYGLLPLIPLPFLFGTTLQLSDLLQEHGYRWFPGAHIAVGAVDTALLLAVLLLAGDPLRTFWLAVVLTWILRGRIDGINHGIMACAALLFLLFVGAPGGQPQHDLQRLIYFLALLGPLGLLHDLLQYTEVRAPRWLRWFFANQHLYWYMIVVGYQVAFELDLQLLVCVYCYVKGYGFFYRLERRALLQRLGIRPPAEEAG